MLGVISAAVSEVMGRGCSGDESGGENGGEKRSESPLLTIDAILEPVAAACSTVVLVDR